MLRQDLRFAFRSLRRTPSFTAIAVLSLGLGIGATTTMYGVVDAVDLRPLPFKDPDRLVALRETRPLTEHACSNPPCPDWTSRLTAADWREQVRSYDALALLGGSWDFNWLHDGESEELHEGKFSLGFLSLLGVHPIIGRDFVAEDTLASAQPVALVTYDFWRVRLGANPHVIGTRMEQLDWWGAPAPAATIVGVLPKGFRFVARQDVWLPLAHEAGPQERDRRDVQVIGRLRSGTAMIRANGELSTIAARLAAAYPEALRDWGATVQPLRRMFEEVDINFGRDRFLLLAIVTLVLFMAAANVAVLLSVRHAVRQAELTVRSALGASRVRLMRQPLAESVCLSLAGGIVGVLIAIAGVHVASVRFASLTPLFGPTIQLDARVLAFATTISIIVGISTGVAPAVYASRANLYNALRAVGTGSPGRAAWTRSTLITTQVAGALVLLTTAGLFSASFLRMRYKSPGYDLRQLYKLWGTPIQWETMNKNQHRLFAEEMRERIARVPGAARVGFESRSGGCERFRPDWADSGKRMHLGLTCMAIDAGYFETLGTRPLSGRAFTAADRVGAPPVVIVNHQAASSLWPGQSAVGRRLYAGESGTAGTAGVWLTVVGVAPDIGVDYVAQSQRVVFRPLEQDTSWYWPGLLVRVVGNSARVETLLRSALAEVTRRPINRRVTLVSSESGAGVASKEDQLAAEVGRPRSDALIFDLFAAFGVLLAAMGLFGIVAYLTANRTREIGIRIALGAERTSVLVLVSREAALSGLAGIAAGVYGSVIVARALGEYIEVPAKDVSPFIVPGAALLLLVIAPFASYLPARRATLVDPAIALRAE